MESQPNPTPGPEKICNVWGCKDLVHEDTKYCHKHRCDYTLSGPRCEDKVRPPSRQYCEGHFEEMSKIREELKKETDEQIKREEERKRCGGHCLEKEELREQLKKAEEELSKREEEKRVEEEGKKEMSGALTPLRNHGQ